MVVVRRIRGEHLHLADEELLLLRTKLVPRLQHIIGPRRQFRILGDHAEPLLVLEDALTQFLVTVVKQVHRVILSTHSFVG